MPLLQPFPSAEDNRQSVPTIYDIAQEADVSVATVSRVLNGRYGVNEHTEARIREAMDRLNFRPRWKAVDARRALVLVPNHSHALVHVHIGSILAGIADAAFASGVSLSLRPFQVNVENRIHLAEFIRQDGASGVLMISTQRGYRMAERIASEGIPHMAIGHLAHEKGMNRIVLDDYESARKGTEYLLGLGHRGIEIVTASRADVSHRLRYEGFAEALSGVVGKAAVPQGLIYEDVGLAAGRSAARMLLSRSDRPTAVLVTNEELATGLLQEALKMGLSIPADLSVLAYESGDRMQGLCPVPSVLSSPAYEMGRTALNWMLPYLLDTDRSAAAPPTGYENTLSHVLTLRETTAPPGKA